MPAGNAVEALLVHMRDWWQSHGLAVDLASHDLERVASDLGISVGDLEMLMSKGPDAADFLYERMHALGITRADVERNAAGLMGDLERTCSCCTDKSACEKDLVVDPGNPIWKRYCPNATTLDAIVKLKHPRHP